MARRRVVRGVTPAAQAAEAGFEEHDRHRLLGYDPDGYADSRFECNFCDRMERLGLLKYVSGDCSGGRSYALTAAGAVALRPLRLAAFDPVI